MLKPFLPLAVLAFATQISIAQSVGIGTTTPAASARLDVSSTTQGMLVPRMTTAQRTAIANPAKGLLVFDNTTSSFWFYNGTVWANLAGSGGGFSLPYSGSASSANNIALFKVVNDDEGDGIWGYSLGGDGVIGTSGSGYGGYFASQVTALVASSLGSGAGGNFSSASGPALITTGGNVGIGNSAPQAPLSFQNQNGNKIDLGYTNANSRIGMGVQSNVMQLYVGAKEGGFAFGYGSSTSFNEQLRITGQGYVGVGTNAPSGRIHIVQPDNSNGLYVENTNPSSVALLATAQNASAITAINKSASAGAIMAQNQGSGPALTTSGRVGINTTSPTLTLDVAGRMRLRHESGSNSTAGLWLDGPTSAQRSFIGTFNQDLMGVYGVSSGWSFLHNVISGNTGIGIGENAPNSKLQVGGSFSLPIKVVTDNYTVTDNDFSVRIELTQNTNVEKTITLPPAAGRTGRIYVISARIPFSGPSTFPDGLSPSVVYIKEAGTDKNVILDDGQPYRGSWVGENALTNHAYHNSFLMDGSQDFYKKFLGITVQSDGNSWKIIDVSYDFYCQYKEP
jgi:hypothetical protein